MLEALRKGAAGPIAIIPIGLLVISFAIWGVGDMFGGRAGKPLAEVGEIKITPVEYQRTLRTELQLLSMRLKTQITPAQARMFGLDRQVLSRLIGGASLDNHARDLHLSLSEKAMLDRILNDPDFKGADGRFDKNRYEEVLRAFGYSKAAYEAEQRQTLMRRQISDALMLGLTPPELVAEIMYGYENEQRKLAYFVLTKAAAGKLPEPDEAALKAYYDKHKARYRSAQYRKIGVIMLTPAALKGRMKVSDAELKAAYEKRAASFNTPEKRAIQQIRFPDMAAAQKAVGAGLKSAKAFAALAKKMKLTDADINLGVKAKRQLIDPALADVIFSLKKGEVSKPVKGRFGVFVFLVSDIVPGITKTYEDVKGQLRDQLAQEKARKEIQTLYDQIEEERAAGEGLQAVAKKFSLPFVLVPAINSNGQDKAGKPVTSVKLNRRMLNEAFRAEIGADIKAIPQPKGGVAWMEVQSIEPQKTKKFAEVKAEVAKALMAEQLRAALIKKANELVLQAKSGKPLAELAKAAGAKLVETKFFKRAGKVPGLPPAVISQAFVLPEKGISSAAVSSSSPDRILFQVTAIKPADKPDEAKLKPLLKKLEVQYADDLLSQYIAGLQQRYPVRIYPDVLQQANAQN